LIQRRAWLAATAGLLLLAGCATPRAPLVPSATGSVSAWSGRLSLRVDSDPVQSFSALFELRGAPEAGQLILTTPLGNTLAQLRWADGEATLQDGRQTRRFDSMDQLIQAATGATIPVAALFAWLDGKPEAVAGWQPDLSQVGAGRLQATRDAPQPRADLRIVFERA
jgi:outer membrane lipoprotein LolB